jgi:hypothetical protein
MSFTTPTYLAVKTATSKSLDHSKRRVISLYRQWQRAVRIPAPLQLMKLTNLPLPGPRNRRNLRPRYPRVRSPITNPSRI